MFNRKTRSSESSFSGRMQGFRFFTKWNCYEKFYQGDEKVINIDFIQSLYKDEDYTIIRFSKDDCIYVKDSYEELSRKLLKLPSETKPSTRKTGRG